MIDVSVIMPIYNNIMIIEELKLKVLNLAKYCKQVILIDDCSIDATYDILYNFIKQIEISNIELYRNGKNMGPSYSRNIGIKKSTGEYMAFLDSDDDWHPQKLEIQIRSMKKYNVKISGTIHQVIDKKMLKANQDKKILNLDNIPIKRIKWPGILFVSPFATPSVVLHNSLKNYLFNEKMRYSEDYNLWQRITYDNPGIKILLPLTYTFKHDYISSDKNCLSINLKNMQRGVEFGYKNLLKSSNIKITSKIMLILAYAFSKLKYLRRIILNMLMNK